MLVKNKTEYKDNKNVQKERVGGQCAVELERYAMQLTSACSAGIDT